MNLRTLLPLALMPTLLLTGMLYGAVPEPPTELQVNYTRCPAVIDTAKPLFGWQVNDQDRGEKQTAYQLRVASSRERCAAGLGDLWDSGKVASAAQNDIVYGGKALSSRASGWWQVRTWDKDDQPSGWSAPAAFELGLLEISDWSASWIGGDYERYRTEVVLPTGKKISKARVYISAKEIFDLTINSARVGSDRVMEPGGSVFAARTRYCTYDVTTNLRTGANAVAVAAGRGRIGHWWLKSSDREFILQIEVFYTDGSSTRIVSGKGVWKGTSSGPLIPLPSQKSELYQGETYDARNGDDWASPGFDDHSWTTITEARPVASGSRLCAQSAPPMKRSALMKAVAITQPWPGIYVFDFGQKISGWTQLSVQGPAGTTVSLKHGEKILTPTTWADYTLTLNAKIINGAAGIRFRIADDDNFYLAQLNADGSFVLQKKVKGAWTKLKEIPLGLIANKNYTVAIDVCGPLIKSSIDGKLIDSTEDKTFGSGKVGFWQHGTETAAFDHITLEPAGHYDLSRGNKYSIPDGCSDDGWWISRSNLKVINLAKTNEKDKNTPRQFVLTDNETMKSYDGGLTGQVDSANLHVFRSRKFADATDRYTLKGGELERWEPHFTMHGFRYVEVVGYPGVPTVDSLQARAAHQSVDENPGSFNCSNELLNKLHSAWKWTYLGSLQFGMPVDCDQRDERTGWTGDAHCSSLAGSYNFDVIKFYDSWMQDLQDTQGTNGNIENIAPVQHISKDGNNINTTWLGAYVIIPWDIYMAAGSKELLGKRYASMKAFIDFQATSHVDNFIDSKNTAVP